MQRLTTRLALAVTVLVVLAGANRWQEASKRGTADGWVTAAEMALMDLRGTQLVVLAACETGLGDASSGEGVFGVRPALLLAGPV